MWGDARKARRHERDDATGEEAVQGCENDDGGIGPDGQPAQEQDAGARALDEHCVEGPDLVGGDAGHDATKDRSGVQDGGHVVGEVMAHTLIQGVLGQVEERRK